MLVKFLHNLSAVESLQHNTYLWITIRGRSIAKYFTTNFVPKSKRRKDSKTRKQKGVTKTIKTTIKCGFSASVLIIVVFLGILLEVVILLVIQNFLELTVHSLTDVVVGCLLLTLTMMMMLPISLKKVLLDNSLNK